MTKLGPAGVKGAMLQSSTPQDKINTQSIHTVQFLAGALGGFSL